MNVLSTDQRQFIISLYRDRGHTQAMIADLVGTTQSNVSKVLARRENMIRRFPLAVPHRVLVPSGSDASPRRNWVHLWNR